MELSGLLRVLRRWWWLIGLVSLVTVVVAWILLQSAGPVYEASVRLELSTQKTDDVDAFLETLRSAQVREAAIDAVGAGDTEVTITRDGAFVEVAARAETPRLAAELASSYADTGLVYFREVRTEPLEEEKRLIAAQLPVAEEDLRAAEAAYAAFQAEHGLTSLEDREVQYERLLAQLISERDQLLVDQATEATDELAEIEALIAERREEEERLAALVPEYHLLDEEAKGTRGYYRTLLAQVGADARGNQGESLRAAEEAMRMADEALAKFQAQHGFASPEEELATVQQLLRQLQGQRDKLLVAQAARADDPLAAVDQLIAQRQEEMEQLAALAPERNLLVEQVKLARSTYEDLAAGYTRIELRAAETQAQVMFEIVRPAEAPSQPVSNLRRLLPIALAASLVLGLVLAFSLEYLLASRAPDTVDSGRQQAQPPPRQDGAAGDRTGRSAPRSAERS